MNQEPLIDELLTRSRTIAVVGLSDNPARPSHGVARYLQEQGYRIIPVNPQLTGPVLGEQPYPALEEVPEPVDLVDIFRRPADVPPVVDAAIAIGAPASVDAVGDRQRRRRTEGEGGRAERGHGPLHGH